MSNLIQGILQGDPRALARAITLIENRSPEGAEILKRVFRQTGKARVIGFTGSPGVGKSSLVDKVAAAYRRGGNTPAIVAVDPSSPFTGGAILGDRIRMSSLSGDAGVFIRSMATRGRLGGLAAATADVASILDAASKDPILIETVGVGQDEVDIVRVAGVCVVVLTPGMGDDIQALKAGIMEIADVFVINKSDRPGAGKLERAILALLALARRADGWVPPIVKTVAVDGTGVEELIEAVDRCYQHLYAAGTPVLRRREAVRQRLMTLLEEQLAHAAVQRRLPNGAMEAAIDGILRRETDPYTVVENIVSEFVGPG